MPLPFYAAAGNRSRSICFSVGSLTLFASPRTSKVRMRIQVMSNCHHSRPWRAENSKAERKPKCVVRFRQETMERKNNATGIHYPYDGWAYHGDYYAILRRTPGSLPTCKRKEGHVRMNRAQHCIIKACRLSG